MENLYVFTNTPAYAIVIGALGSLLAVGLIRFGAFLTRRFFPAYINDWQSDNYVLTEIVESKDIEQRVFMLIYYGFFLLGLIVLACTVMVFIVLHKELDAGSQWKLGLYVFVSFFLIFYMKNYIEKIRILKKSVFDNFGKAEDVYW